MKKYNFEQAKQKVLEAKHKRIYALNDSGNQAIIIYNALTKSIMISSGSEKFENGWMIHNGAYTFTEVFRPGIFAAEVIIYTDPDGHEHEYFDLDQVISLRHMQQQRWHTESRLMRRKRHERLSKEYRPQTDENVKGFIDEVDAGMYDRQTVIDTLNHYPGDYRV